MLVDTHAHLQFRGTYDNRLEEVFENAKAAGVEKIVCVGVDEHDSAKAIELAAQYDHIYATAGLHPHDAKLGRDAFERLAQLAGQPRVVAIGECGLDYFYNHSNKSEQEAAFRFQIELALQHNLPMVWHVRDAFDDFFRITDDYPGLRGIVHCFTSTPQNASKALERGYYIALNGIMTFTKDQTQLDAAKIIPLNRLVLETDCPFLTPAPNRGRENEPAYIKITAEFLADLRGESYDALAEATSQNAISLLGLA